MKSVSLKKKDKKKKVGTYLILYSIGNMIKLYMSIFKLESKVLCYFYVLDGRIVIYCIIF